MERDNRATAPLDKVVILFLLEGPRAVHVEAAVDLQSESAVRVTQAAVVPLLQIVEPEAAVAAAAPREPEAAATGRPVGRPEGAEDR